MKKSFLLFMLSAFLFQSCFVSNTTKLKGHKPLFGKLKVDENEIKNSGQVNQEQIVKNETKQETLSELSIENPEITDISSIENEIIDISKQKIHLLDGGCDKITFLNGNEEEVKLIEIGDDFIKYKKCNNLDGPIYNTSREKLFMISYSNGTKELIQQKKVESSTVTKETIIKTNEENETSSNQVIHPLAITSFILGVLGFIPAVGLILGGIASNQISDNPKKYKGEGFALAGMILSLVWVVVLIIVFL
jgi:hypothetical protein